MKIFNKSLIIITLCCLFSLPSIAQNQFGGLALYTLREDLKDNPKDVLKEVAKIGYKYVESAGYENGKFYGMEPTEFKSYLESIGLQPVSSHMHMITLENADELISDVKEAGFEYLVIPIPPMGMFTFDQATMSMGMKGSVEDLANILTTLGKKCNDAGIKMLYHNHDFEFKKNSEGIVPIEYLLEHVSPEYLNFQMDLYWVTKAGADPVAYFDKYPGRFKIWHVKDMDDQGRFAPVGTGHIDFGRILDKKDTSGMVYYMVEQDMCFDITPIEAIKVSHKGLEEIGFE